MEVPEIFMDQVADAINAELVAAEVTAETMQRKGRWAVIYGLVPFIDGDKWCVLLGQNIQTGIAGFGESPEEAIINFDAEMAKRIN